MCESSDKTSDSYLLSAKFGAHRQHTLSSHVAVSFDAHDTAPAMLRRDRKSNRLSRANMGMSIYRAGNTVESIVEPEDPLHTLKE